MPTEEEIKQKVRSEVADEANLDIDSVEDEQILANAPLNLDRVALAMLALTLRRYIKSYRPDQTLLAKEVRKSGLTVKTLIDLIYEKLQ